MANYKAYKSEWDKKNSKLLAIRLNKVKDGHIIRWLETIPNWSKYIRDLIDADISKNLGE